MYMNNYMNNYYPQIQVGGTPPTKHENEILKSCIIVHLILFIISIILVTKSKIKKDKNNCINPVEIEDNYNNSIIVVGIGGAFFAIVVLCEIIGKKYDYENTLWGEESKWVFITLLVISLVLMIISIVFIMDVKKYKNEYNEDDCPTNSGPTNSGPTNSGPTNSGPI
jgi:hypothetical protein